LKERQTVSWSQGLDGLLNETFFNNLRLMDAGGYTLADRADEGCRQTRDFYPRNGSRGNAFDGVYAAVERHDSAGEGLLPAHDAPVRRSPHAVFALLLQDGGIA